MSRRARRRPRTRPSLQRAGDGTRPAQVLERLDQETAADASMSGRAAAAVFLVALAVRLVHVWQLSDAPFFTHLFGDARGYDRWAQRLAAGDWFGREVFYQAPLYPYFLGVFYALVGRDLLLVRLAQAVIGALACSVVALAGMKWFGRRAGTIAGVLLACYAPALFFDGLIQKSVLDGLLVAALLLALAGLRRDSSHAPGFVAGALLGLLALTRENALILLPVVVLWIWLRTGRRPKAALATLAATALALSPAIAHNLAVSGELHLTTAQLGPNFYIGNHSGAAGTYVPLREGRGSVEFERQDATEIAEAAEGRRLSPREVSRYWLRRGLDWIRAEPGAWVRLSARKILLLLNATEAADTEDVATHAEPSVLLRVSASLLHFGVLAPLALLGVWMTRRRWRELWLLYAFCTMFGLSLVGFYVLDRYRYPLVPVLVLFAGAALGDARRYWTAGTRRERGFALAVIVAALVVCNWPLQSSTDMQALTHYNIAAALQADRLDDRAEAEYRAALALQPGLARAHTNLGVLLAAKRRDEEAVFHAREGARLNPRSSRAFVNLGIVLARTGGAEEAVGAFADALRLDPGLDDAHYNLANVLAALGRDEEAVEHLHETLRLAPSRADAHNNLGILLCSQGRCAEGIEHFEEAVRQAPGFREAAANLERARRLSPQ